MLMSGRVASCCVALVVTLACASAVQKLDSISDLKTIDFGQSVPKHSLILLHWFANVVEIDNNNVIRLTFDPNNDYGSHQYRNFERMLDVLPRRYLYYTIGNLNPIGTSVVLPQYVTHPQREYNGNNRDRIIMRIREQTIDRVFITQHYEAWENRGILYDPNHTYQITTTLLRQIREFSLRDNHQPLLYLRNRYQSSANIIDITLQWGNLSCLGLFLFIVIKEKHTPRQDNNRPPLPRNYNRPKVTYTPENNNRQLPMNSNSNTRQDSNRRHDNNTPTNCRCPWWCIVPFVFIIIILVVFIVVYFVKTK